MFDNEISCDQQLIEEREIYENSFIDLEAIAKSNELDFYTTSRYRQYFDEDFEQSLSSFDRRFMDDNYVDMLADEYLDDIREEILIEDRLAEEKAFVEELLDSRREPVFFDDYDDCYVEDLGHVEGAYSGSEMVGYTIDESDRLGYCDYP